MKKILRSIGTGISLPPKVGHCPKSTGPLLNALLIILKHCLDARILWSEQLTNKSNNYD